jgi:uncharacterized protein (TIGR02001 family)
MTTTLKSAVCALSAAAAVFSAAPAFAADEAPKFAYSFNIGGTNDYVFRGYSQNRENPAVQGGIDLTYGIAYFGVWASNIDFGPNGDGSKAVSTEVDLYAGIKPVVGPVTFDLGVIYYAYPGANDRGTLKNQLKEQDYVEIKGGASGAIIPMLPKLTLGGVLYYSNEYQGGQNEVLTTEVSAAYELPAIGAVTPTISGLYGRQYGDATDGFTLGNGKDEVGYWNAGITLAVDKFSFDFRYWNTDVKDTAAFKCNGPANQCDERFVFLGKFTY